MKLSERMKHWPALTVHRVVEIEAALVSLEERLTALEPKKFDEKEVKPAPFLPISSPVPPDAAPKPIIEPSILPAPKPPGFNKPEVTPTPSPFVPTPYVHEQVKPEPVKPVDQPWSEPVRLGPTPSFNPLDGTNLKS